MSADIWLLLSCVVPKTISVYIDKRYRLSNVHRIKLRYRIAFTLATLAYILATVYTTALRRRVVVFSVISLDNYHCMMFVTHQCVSSWSLCFISQF